MLSHDQVSVEDRRDFSQQSLRSENVTGKRKCEQSNFEFISCEIFSGKQRTMVAGWELITC